MTITRFTIILIVYFISVVYLPFSNIFSQNYSYTSWKEQLGNLINNLHEESKGDICYLHLIDYTYMGVIKSEEDKSKIIDSLLSDNAPTILHLPHLTVCDTILTDSSYKIRTRRFPMFEIIPISKVVSIYESIGEKNPIIQAKQELNEVIEVGFEYLKLKWSYKDNMFFSICIVSNKNGGIIYDHIGTQINTEEELVIFEEKNISNFK